ncbi:short transmembrane mitochondrial protein 1 [Pogonomyrmex barbatus]|uniref:Short transmembrane mitochondrial protein 1 n=1 Tax=Pogonomyrmex barbatus TaxID=144034 RepID=A0A6I9XCW3_9HYME|nr:short transmembrane mitochondrial protein 1 [Pogonomyrmex barbatus]
MSISVLRVSTSEILRLNKHTLKTLDMLRFLISLSIGVYAGIYIAQNYEVPRVDEPAKLYQRVLQFLEENKKKP